MKSFEKVSGITALVKNSENRSFVSGDQEDRIKIDYFFNKENGHVFAKVIFGRLAQGPPNHAHGGAISAVLDEAMGAVAWLNGYPTMTVQLTVNYIKALPLKTETIVEAWIEKMTDKKIRVKGRITEKNGKIFAKSSGIFVLLSKDQLQELGNFPQELIEKISGNSY